jgi:hypothetical protein
MGNLKAIFYEKIQMKFLILTCTIYRIRRKTRTLL